MLQRMMRFGLRRYSPSICPYVAGMLVSDVYAATNTWSGLVSRSEIFGDTESRATSDGSAASNMAGSPCKPRRLARTLGALFGDP